MAGAREQRPDASSGGDGASASRSALIITALEVETVAVRRHVRESEAPQPDRWGILVAWLATV